MVDTLGNENLVNSRERVIDHGEVYTAKREVNAMLDLVKQETERIDSRFLEPACGMGNFLIEILKRKLDVVEGRYKRSQVEFERYSFVAVSSIYGIDILEDNVIGCRERLLDYFWTRYSGIYKTKIREELKKTLKFVLEKNIIWGDALTLNSVDEDQGPIVFAEWAMVKEGLVKRRDFTYSEILGQAEMQQAPLFANAKKETFGDYYKKEYPPVHFLKVADVQD
jgi:hypothetical protein